MHHNLLDGIPMFAALTGDETWDLARRITVRETPARQVLFWIGEPGNEFFVIKSGHVLITVPDGDGKEVTLAVLGPGDFFGEISLLDGGPRTATARTQTDCSLLCLEREAFFKFIHETPAAAVHMMNVLGKRQRESVDKLRGIKNLNEVMAEKLTTWQRVANTIAATAANKAFLLTHAIAFVAWIALNLALGSRGPDPYPFPFLCFWSSTEAIFLSLFILISQNLQSQKDRLRTELEYQVALKAQFEIMQLHRKLDELPGTVKGIVESREKEADGEQETVTARP
jgi:uncharacterized membrane protein